MKQKNFNKLIILIVFSSQLLKPATNLIIDDESSDSSIDVNYSSSGSVNNKNSTENIINNIDTNPNTNNTDHVCYREETYIEQIRIPVKQPVRIRLSNWCLEFPPRCSNYKTEIREVIKVQNITRTKIVEFCCEGYAEIKSGNETICKPTCRGGCGKGFCRAPNECSCDAGYTGRHCTQRCRHGQWGEKCEKLCKCRNDSICDSVTGICECNTGWIGELCDFPCPDGFYGQMCRNQCECSSNRCNSQTGECIVEEVITKLKPIKDITTTITPYVMMTTSTFDNGTSIKKNQSEEVSIANEHKTDTKQENTTNLIIETLNSTIANLTENIDKLTKNLDKQQHTEPLKVIVPETIVEITTPSTKSVPGVIVINPADNSNPAVIIHHPSATNITTVPAVKPPPEIIHVITNLQQHLVDETLKNETVNEHNSPSSSRNGNDLTAVIIIILIFLILIALSVSGFVIIYRRFLKNRQETNNSMTRRNQPNEVNQEIKICAKPLPDLPAFTQSLTKAIIPAVYDSPKNNSIVPSILAPIPHSSLHPYSYTTANGSIYSHTSKSYARKHSMEHLYDEIKYPTLHSATSRL